MSAIKSYMLFNSLKLHFTSDYNHFKYNGKVRLPKNGIPENQKYVYDKIFQLYKDDLEDFYVANILENPKIWINELLSEESVKVFKDYQRSKESFSYIFRNDINKLLGECEDLNQTLKVDEDFPLLLKWTLQKRVHLNTLLSLNSIVKFYSYWDKKLTGNVIWSEFSFKCRKYFPFMKFDETKLKEILKQEIKRNM